MKFSNNEQKCYILKIKFLNMPKTVLLLVALNCCSGPHHSELLETAVAGSLLVFCLYTSPCHILSPSQSTRCVSLEQPPLVGSTQPPVLYLRSFSHLPSSLSL